MVNLNKVLSVVLTSVICAYAGVSLVTKDLNPVHWGASFRNQIAINNARHRELEETAKENLRLYNQVLRKAEMHDGKIGLSWYDKAKLSQDLGVEWIIEEGSQIEFKSPYRSYALKISITDFSKKPPYRAYAIPKEKLLEYLNK